VTTTNEYTDLPDDDEQAFVHLEKAFRHTLNEDLQHSDNNNGYNAACRDYVNRTVAAAKALNIAEFRSVEIPTNGDAGRVCTELRTVVDHYLVQIQIKHARRDMGYSVALDPPTKLKIRHFLEQVKQLFDRLENVPERKKEALYRKLNALIDEVDRTRTRYDVYADLAIEVSNTTGKVARNLRPASKFLDQIMKLLGKAKEAEGTRALPAPPKQLEPPKMRLLAPKNPPARPDLDDEIPF
jgi:hypothetical protein